jgi:PTH1 family peptidyl-tRNA hydrolase
LPRPFAGARARGSGGGTAIDWLIVGLGNPGREYARTRHNVGFMVADALAERWELPRPRARFNGLIAEGVRPGVAAEAVRPGSAAEAVRPGSAAEGIRLGVAAEGVRPGSAAEGVRLRVAVLWPQTFMNDAGRSAGPARGSYKLPLERVVVVHDEIDLPFGEVRTRLGGGLAGHNGLKSLRRELGGADFWRVRVGVGRPNSTDPEIVSAHVLGRFRERPEEVRELVERARDEVELLVSAPASPVSAR